MLAMMGAVLTTVSITTSVLPNRELPRQMDKGRHTRHNRPFNARWSRQIVCRVDS